MPGGSVYPGEKEDGYVVEWLLVRGEGREGVDVGCLGWVRRWERLGMVGRLGS